MLASSSVLSLFKASFASVPAALLPVQCIEASWQGQLPAGPCTGVLHTAEEGPALLTPSRLWLLYSASLVP